MQDIADAMGVSNATVSRAFRGDPKCGSELRAKILKKAEEMGYEVDAMQSLHMRRLRSGAGSHAPVIALLDWCPLELWGAKRERIIQGATEEANKHGIKLEVINLITNPMSTERLREVLHARGVRGLIIGVIPTPESNLDLDLSGISTVCLTSMQHPQLHVISDNQYVNLWRGLEALRGKGYRRVGLAIADQVEDRYYWRRQAALFAFCQKHQDMAPAPLFTYPRHLGEEEKQREIHPAFLDWVKNEKLDVVMGISNWIPEVLKAGGYRVPEDVLFFLCSSQGPGTTDAPAGIHPRWSKIGAAAVDMVYGQWARFEYGVPESPIQLELVGDVFGL